MSVGRLLKVVSDVRQFFIGWDHFSISASPKCQNNPTPDIAIYKNVSMNPSVGRELWRKKAYGHG